MHLQTLLKSQQDKAFLYEIMNILFRTQNNEKLAMMMDELLKQHTLGEFFSSTQKALFWIFQHSTKNIPDISIPFLQEYIKQECHKFLVDAYEIDHFLEKCAFQDKKATITFLEPMALHEEEAFKVVEKYLQILANEKVERISIEITTIEPKINFISNNDCLLHLETKFSMILRQALKYRLNSKKSKFVNFELSTETFAKSFETLTKILIKEEFLSSCIGFSFKVDLLKSHEFLSKILIFAQENVSRKGQKVSIRIEDNSMNDGQNYFEQALYFLLKKENESLIDIVVNSNNSYRIELLEVMALKNGLQNMVETETFLGFPFLGKKSHWLYAPIVSFEHFLNAIDYLIEKLEPQKVKNIFYDFDCKNTVFLSSLCHKNESLENILEKINLVYEKSDFLDLQLLIEEEFFEEFSQKLSDSLKALFRCMNPQTKLHFTSNDFSHRFIMISLDEFKGNIELTMVKNMHEAIALINAQTFKGAYKIYTVYENQEKEFYQRITS